MPWLSRRTWMRNLPRAFLTDEVLPHARAEERTLYPAAGRAPDASLLVRALTSDHRDLIAMAVRLDEPAPPAAAHRRPDRGGRRGEPVGGVPGGGSAGRSGRRRLGSSRRHAV